MSGAAAVEPTNRQHAGRGILTLIAAATFALTTAVTMIGPLLVDLAREFDVPLGTAGLLAAGMSAPWALLAPLAGALSDRFGRRPLVLFSLGGMGAFTLAAAFAPGFGVLLLCRVLAGVFGACGPPSLMAAVGDLFPPARRAEAMGWLNTGFSMAAVLGTPLVGAVGGLVGWRWGFALTGLVLLLTALVALVTFPAARGDKAPESLLAAWRAVFQLPELRYVLAANVSERTAFHATAVYLPSLLMLTYALSAAAVAPVLTVVALGAIGGNVVGGWLGDRWPRPLVFLVTQLGAAVLALALYGLDFSLLLSAAAGVLFGLVNASGRPAFLALSSELAPAYRGAVLGLISFTNQGGVVVGSALGGVVIGLAGYPALGVGVALACVLSSLFSLPLLRARALAPPPAEQRA